jgi:hypothetical protein
MGKKVKEQFQNSDSNSLSSYSTFIGKRILEMSLTMTVEILTNNSQGSKIHYSYHSMTNELQNELMNYEFSPKGTKCDKIDAFSHL